MISSRSNSFISGVFCHEQGDQRVPNILPRVIYYAERRYGQKPWVSTQETLKSLTNVELCTQSGLLGRAFVQGMAHPLNTCG